MDVYDFFNSPDVAGHCKSIGKTFNALESAVMINQSRSKPLAEKHAAYRTIITEYPDMERPDTSNRGHVISFHNKLQKFIAYEEKLLEIFLTPELGAVYQTTIHARTPREYSYDRGLFTSYEKSLADTLEHLKENKDIDVSEYPYGKINFLSLSICKKYLDNDKYIEAKVSRSGDVIGINNTNIRPSYDYCAGDLDLLDRYIDIPAPFKRGDLVEYSINDSWMGSVFVVKNICRDDQKIHPERFIHGNITDMTADVFYEINGLVECESMHFYPDLLYCRRELEGEARILKYVSLFMKEELCLCHLLKLQKFMLADKIMSEAKYDTYLKTELERKGD